MKTLDKITVGLYINTVKRTTGTVMAKDLTARQKEIIDLIQRHIDDTGFPPTRAEIAKELGFRSANAAEEDQQRCLDAGMSDYLSKPASKALIDAILIKWLGKVQRG